MPDNKVFQIQPHATALRTNSINQRSKSIVGQVHQIHSSLLTVTQITLFLETIMHAEKIEMFPEMHCLEQAGY